MKTFTDLFSITNSSLSETQIHIVESELGFLIPNSLRQLYLLSNGYRINQMRDLVYAVYCNNEPLGEFMRIYDIEDLKSTYNHFKLCEVDGLGDFGTNRFIAFSDIGRAFICLGHTGEDSGKVYWMDTGNPINETDFEIFKLADSLEEFIEGLKYGQ